jgi:hypothetical protein
MTLSSCQNEIDNWYSEAFDYSGRFVASTTCEEYSDDDTSIKDGNEILIYNSAANVKNEVWIDAQVAGAHMKGKFTLSGDASSFTSASGTAKNVNSSVYYIDTDYGLVPFSSSYANYFREPTAAGQINDGVQLYTRITLEEGKILAKSATTIGGNVSDSVYIKCVLHHDQVQFVSHAIPDYLWETPGVPEYEWKLKENSNSFDAEWDADWDEHWTLSGYRYTGYPEDR